MSINTSQNPNGHETAGTAFLDNEGLVLETACVLNLGWLVIGAMLEGNQRGRYTVAAVELLCFKLIRIFCKYLNLPVGMRATLELCLEHGSVSLLLR
jgi:hypothetical protein